MSYVTVRDAIQTAIEDNLVDVSPTSSTVHKRIPGNILDSQGYSIIIRMPGGSFSLGSTSQYAERQTWLVDVYAPNVNTSYASEQEDRLLKYADLIVTIFTNTRKLTLVDDPRKTTNVTLSNITFNDQDYPQGSEAVKRHFTVTLTIPAYSRSRNC